MSLLLAALLGIASWYPGTPGQAAAGPALREGDWRDSAVAVCRVPFRVLFARCVVVTLSDWCQCYRGTERERLIDLDRRDFARLAPASRGLVRVVVYR